MGTTYPIIDEKMHEWIQAQHLFFVATAPQSNDGLINCSPKGLDSFRILDPLTVAYLDMTGSGIETTAHLRENGRITLMFCAFEGPPKILRLYGRGESLERGTTEFEKLLPNFKKAVGMRSIIRVNVSRIMDSCGWGVPLYDFQSDRTTLNDASEKWGENKLASYRREQNTTSLDGLPGWEGKATTNPDEANDHGA